MFSQLTSPESSEENRTKPVASSEGPELELLLAGSWNRPLRKRLLDHLRDTLSPEKLPPLRLTSRPVDVGMLAAGGCRRVDLRSNESHVVEFAAAQPR